MFIWLGVADRVAAAQRSVEAVDGTGNGGVCKEATVGAKMVQNQAIESVVNEDRPSAARLSNRIPLNKEKGAQFHAAKLSGAVITKRTANYGRAMYKSGRDAAPHGAGCAVSGGRAAPSVGMEIGDGAVLGIVPGARGP